MAAAGFWMTMIFYGIGLFLLFGVSIFSLVSIAFVGLVYGAPWVPTRGRVARAMVQAAELTGEEVVVDLGCGNGVILFEALSTGKAKRIIGIDRNPLLIWQCRLIAWWKGYQDRSEFSCADVRTVSLPRADVVMLYLLPPLMQVVRPRLKAGFAPETKILSNSFVFSGVPVRQTVPDDHYPIHLYQAQDL